MLPKERGWTIQHFVVNSLYILLNIPALSICKVQNHFDGPPLGIQWAVDAVSIIYDWTRAQPRACTTVRQAWHMVVASRKRLLLAAEVLTDFRVAKIRIT